MELTLDQALQKGVEAHKAGQVQEADRYYTAILKANPKHPDANHNMGVLAVGVGKVQEALPFFKTALDANSSIAQYWLSYIDALIKLNRMDDAKAVFDRAKRNGVTEADFDKLKEQLRTTNQEPTQHQLQPLINLYAQGQYEQTLSEASQLLIEFPNSGTLFNIIGVANQGQGKLEEAIDAYQKAISIKPDYADAYNNMGLALKDQSKPEEAIDSFKRAISIKHDYAEAYYNMGNAIQGQGKPDEAIEAYTRALSIKPDYAEAYNNMGNALQNQGKLEEAVKAYNKVLYIKHDYAEAYNNLGNALKKQSKLEEAIEAYKKALSIKPDYDEAWNNLYFPLHAVKETINSEQKLMSLYPKNDRSVYAEIGLSILHYRLNQGHKNKNISFDRALESISHAKNLKVKNLKSKNNPLEQKQILPNKVIALVHFGRSGTGLLHSLIDGHPQVSTLPSIYFSQYFDHSTWVRISSAGWDEMADRFMSIYDVLFDATSSVPIESKSKQRSYNIGIEEGMANVGNQQDEVLRVDKKKFKKELYDLLNLYSEINPLTFFKLVHKAYIK